MDCFARSDFRKPYAPTRRKSEARAYTQEQLDFVRNVSSLALRPSAAAQVNDVVWNESGLCCLPSPQSPSHYEYSREHAVAPVKSARGTKYCLAPFAVASLFSVGCKHCQCRRS